MNRTTGIRMTAWLGILAVCLAMLMPGVNALKNRYQASGNSIFMADICYGAQADQAPALALDNAERPVLLTDSTQVGADVAGVVLTPAHVAHGGMPILSDSLAGGDAPASSGHSADHAVECLYCGFFTHHLPLLYSATLPAMSYGFISRIAPQHQHASYYAQPAFVPLSRAPPILS